VAYDEHVHTVFDEYSDSGDGEAEEDKDEDEEDEEDENDANWARKEALRQGKVWTKGEPHDRFLFSSWRPFPTGFLADQARSGTQAAIKSRARAHAGIESAGQRHTRNIGSPALGWCISSSKATDSFCHCMPSRVASVPAPLRVRALCSVTQAAPTRT